MSQNGDQSQQAEPGAPADNSGNKRKKNVFGSLIANPLYSLGVVLAVLMLPAAVYMGWDLADSQLNPCEKIYQQSTVGLSTKLKFLEAEGEIQIGKRKLEDLDDRAQAVALNLKTCCTVLDAGKLDPEQFLQCKSKGRDYDERLDQLVALVKQAVGSPTVVALAKTPGSGASNGPSDPVVTGSVAAAVTPANLKKQISSVVKKAEAASKAFNTQVVKVRKEQAVAQLEVLPPQNVDVSAQEKEPNSDLLNTNQVTLGKWVTAAVGAKGDWDYFVFKSPETHRDWVTIEVQNRSTSLRPRILVYNDQKSQIGDKLNGTAGGDAKHSFVVGPSQKFIVGIGDRYGDRTGAYLFRVSANKSYDAFEPNQNVLQARKSSIGTAIEASIMDGKDWDFFSFASEGMKGKISVTFENRSLTLKPKVVLYNGSKAYVGEKVNNTAGADLDYVFDVPSGKRFFIAVTSRYGSTNGDYTLNVDKR